MIANDADDKALMAAPIPLIPYTPDEADKAELISEVNEFEEELLRMVEDLEVMSGINKRFLAIAKTDLQKAFMVLTSAIVNRPRISLPGDEDQNELDL